MYSYLGTSGTTWYHTGTMVPRYGRIKKINSSVFPYPLFYLLNLVLLHETNLAKCAMKASSTDAFPKMPGINSYVFNKLGCASTASAHDFNHGSFCKVLFKIVVAIISQNNAQSRKEIP